MNRKQRQSSWKKTKPIRTPNRESAREDDRVTTRQAPQNGQLVPPRSGSQDGQVQRHAFIQENILKLQRRHGNGFVQRLLQNFTESPTSRDVQAVQRQERDDPTRGNESLNTQPESPGIAVENSGADGGKAPFKQQQESPNGQLEQGSMTKAQVAGSRSATTMNQIQQRTEKQSAPQEAKKTAAQPGSGMGSEASSPPGKDKKEDKKSSPGNQKGGGSRQTQAIQKPGNKPGIGAEHAAEQSASAELEPQSAQSALANPQYQAAVEQINQVAQQEKAHPPGTTKAQEAQQAAQAPASEVEARAQSQQAQDMQHAEVPAFDAAGFKAQLMQRIKALTPRTAEQAEQFKASNKVGNLKSELKGKVEQESKKSKGPIEQKTRQAPNTGAVPPKQVTPLQSFQSGPQPEISAAQQIAPEPKKQTEVEEPLMKGASSLDQQMAEAEITEEQLARSNEPEFEQALEQKKTLEKQVKEAPPVYRQEEQEIISQAKTESEESADQGVQEMHSKRDQAMEQVGSEQQEAKSADETERARIAADVQGIFTNTKTKVESLLGVMKSEVDTAFNTGAEAAKQAFENFVTRKMKAYKESRYGGIFGWMKWAKDKLLGMPPEVNAFYVQGRTLYIAQMDAVINNIVTIISEKLGEAKSEIANGKAEIDDYIAQLPADLLEVGRQAADEIKVRFDQLENQVDETENGLVEQLAEIYNSHLNEVDSRITALKAENEGLVQKLADGISQVLKTVIQLKEKLFTVMERAAGAIKSIIRDPIGFLDNLISGVSKGFSKFVENVNTHLKKGLISWLAKTLGDAGIELPESFDLKGIFAMVTQVLGVTWATIRERASALLGEDIVNRLEQVFDMFVNLKNEGPAAIWDFVKDKLGDLNELILVPIKQFLSQEVLKNGIQKILGLLGSPAKTFVNAANAIYKIVSWFIGHGSKITSLVTAIFSAVKNIAGGSISQAAEIIERSLSKAIPVTINFLADLLGLGDLSEKIKSIIQKIRNPIDKIIDWVIKKAAKVARKVTGGMGFGKEGSAQ